MKATLEFNLNDPDDRREHLRCVKSTDMAIVLWEIQTNFKKKCEHIIEANTEKDDQIDPWEAFEIIFEQISELYNDQNINVDDLII